MFSRHSEIQKTVHRRDWDWAVTWFKTVLSSRVSYSFVVADWITLIFFLSTVTLHCKALLHHFSFHFGLLVLDLWLLTQKWFSQRRLSCWCYLGFLSVACVKGICFESKTCISVLLANRIKTLSFSATLNTLLSS